MSQHLVLYASKTLTADEVAKWCHARALELIEISSREDQPIVDRVQAEMVRLRYKEDRIEHWSNWCGVMIWDFLVWEPYYCDEALVGRAVKAAADAMQTHAGLRSSYPGRDFTKDEAVEFLRAHIGYIVWGDNDGI